MNLDHARRWFERHGNMHPEYLDLHFERFARTHRFAVEGVTQPLDVLDIGAHWLHQALFFAQDGHRVVCTDAPAQIRLPSVVSAAAEMGARLVPTLRLDKADGLRDLKPDSVDLVLFCEIIEHLAFNPAELWSAIYRAMRPGARLIVSTPNALYLPFFRGHLHNIVLDGCVGNRVDEIFTTGTYGHHWKEFSEPELVRYFEAVSPDFRIGRIDRWERWADPDVATEIERLSAPPEDMVDAKDVHALVRAVLGHMVRSGHDLATSNLMIEVLLPVKSVGLTLKAPWTVD